MPYHDEFFFLNHPYYKHFGFKSIKDLMVKLNITESEDAKSSMTYVVKLGDKEVARSLEPLAAVWVAHNLFGKTLSKDYKKNTN